MKFPSHNPLTHTIESTSTTALPAERPLRNASLTYKKECLYARIIAIHSSKTTLKNHCPYLRRTYSVKIEVLILVG